MRRRCTTPAIVFVAVRVNLCTRLASIARATATGPHIVPTIYSVAQRLSFMHSLVTLIAGVHAQVVLHVLECREPDGIDKWTFAVLPTGKVRRLPNVHGVGVVLAMLRMLAHGLHAVLGALDSHDRRIVKFCRCIKHRGTRNERSSAPAVPHSGCGSSL